MIRDFANRHFRHFNAAALVEAAEGWADHLRKGGKMLVAMGGAMSTAEIGVSLAELIRQRKVHCISCTGANLEEDLYNLVSHSDFRRIPEYRYLSVEQEMALREEGLNRVTDTCIPEDGAMRKVERHIIRLWERCGRTSGRHFPYEFVYQLLEQEDFRAEFDIDPKDSWVHASWEQGIPILTPGWEDSTLGNRFVASVLEGRVSDFGVVKSGLEQMAALIDWYTESSRRSSIGFFQIGGGIAGDFPICVVPLIEKDLGRSCALWGYFCQISDSTTSFGSYSGAVPNEKITWGKIGPQTPRFMIESDATIVAPLIFEYVLES